MNGREGIRHFWTQLPFFAWLVALWMMLWGQFTVLALVTGILVAVFVTTAFRLPTAELTGRVNAWWLLVGIARFLVDLVHGAVQVSWWTIAPRTPSAAIVRVPLRIDDDLIMTHVGVALSLVPGSTVIEADRTNRVLFLHAIGVASTKDIARVRAKALAWEARIVRAVGSRDELAAVTARVAPYVERQAAGGVS
ncbi:Na+/H+ antiporter subunit E [Microbacterium karelineae]|uniref:Na+/H+ antiporter subunit E n=1 Tax=Microbacterium karelineae TaxID=2654283 RepID=UPI001E4E6A3D|nr:Na+/H+ antiporter subunit E [Microbacterium karelineae]